MLLLILDPSKKTFSFSAGDPIHILNEEQSQPDADYWSMLCGLTVRAYDNGDLSPNVDFYLPADGHKATCSVCLRVRSERG